MFRFRPEGKCAGEHPLNKVTGLPSVRHIRANSRSSILGAIRTIQNSAACEACANAMVITGHRGRRSLYDRRNEWHRVRSDERAFCARIVRRTGNEDGCWHIPGRDRGQVPRRPGRPFALPGFQLAAHRWLSGGGGRRHVCRYGSRGASRCTCSPTWVRMVCVVAGGGTGGAERDGRARRAVTIRRPSVPYLFVKDAAPPIAALWVERPQSLWQPGDFPPRGTEPGWSRRQ